MVLFRQQNEKSLALLEVNKSLSTEIWSFLLPGSDFVQRVMQAFRTLRDIPAKA
jgi:hypothetical protein